MPLTLAERHTAVPASSGDRLVSTAGSVTSNVTLTAALGDIAAHGLGNTSLQI